MTTTDLTLATQGDHLLGATVDGPDGTYCVQFLTTGQAALVALDLLPMLEAAAKERDAQRKSNHVTVADLPQSSPAKSRDQAAKMVGTSGRAVGQAKRVATVSA